MITCKLCNTKLEKKHLRRDGSMLCPECGQIYWKAAVDKAREDTADHREIIERAYLHESLLRVDQIRRMRLA